MKAKDETAIFFFEEAIKAAPHQVERLIAIAKRSPGYPSCKVLQDRIKEEEGKMNRVNEEADIDSSNESRITQYMVIGKTKLPRPGTVCKLSKLDGRSCGGPGVLCSSDTLEDGFEKVKSNLQYLDSLCKGSIYLVEVDILNVPISAFVLCGLLGSTYSDPTVKYIAKHQSITSNL